ncbi:MAG: TonB-dependent receptor [Xanthomonadales bacterium]|jgi:iron complex outermembrane receptor protein|nr:TonB-dependent receptor [Xanthomonadales bacterium]
MSFMTPGPQRRPLYHAVACALTLALAGAAQAQSTADDDSDRDVLELEEIVVTATPIGRSAVELTQSAVVLQGEELNSELNNSIGETLTRLPGLNNASFGQNVGRPVIRGQQGVRIGVLNNNMNNFDASAVSQDHAVATEPFLADQVEVLRGPNTLLYGSSAIGGVVNVVTNTIPVTVPEDGFDGRAMIQGDTAADERFGAARFDIGFGNFAFHANGFYRRTDDYEIPGAAELFPDDDHDDHGHEGEAHDEHDHGEEEMTGILENSFLDNEGGAVGGAWIGEKWRAGLSYTAYDSNYGIPGGHAHAHGEEEHEGEEHDEEHEGEEEEEIVTIDLESQRIDALLNGMDPFAGFSEFDLRIANTDYTHTEFEGLETGTVFDSETTDLRLELTHNPLGSFEGTFGLQWSDNDFTAVGEEAFVAPSTTETWGLFLVETWQVNDALLFDLGLRYEDTSIDSFIIEHDHDHEGEEHEGEEHEDEMPEAASRSFNPFSVSVGAKWEVTERSHFTFNVARAERAPASVELFSNGPHIATQTFEVGDPDLGKETNTHYSGTYRLKEGAFTGAITLYYDDYDDFIYLADTGEMEDGFPERIWSQQDAEFTGGELEVRYDLGDTAIGNWQLFGFYDRVRAELADGSNVPRIPPQRFGLGADWNTAQWRGNVTWINADDHTRTAEFETPTPGYDLLNAELSFYLPLAGGDADLEFYLKGRNLLDEDIRNSSSFLKDDAPQIGRNFVFGVRTTF